MKILGVTLSNNLKWETHTRNLINGLKFCYRSFCRSCKMLNTDTRKMLYNAAIASRMNYCDAIWDACNSNTRSKLQTIQNRCARRILNRPPGTTAAPLIKELGWISLEKKRKLHKCVLLHKLLQGTGPSPLINMLEPYNNRTALNTRGTANNCLYIPSFKTNYIKKSFFMDSAKLWNSLPLDIKSTTNSSTFKEKLHAYFLNGTPD